MAPRQKKTTDEYRSGFTDCRSVILARLSIALEKLPGGDRAATASAMIDIVRNTPVPREEK